MTTQNDRLAPWHGSETVSESSARAAAGSPGARMPVDAPPAVDAPGTDQATSTPATDHLAVRQALRAERRLMAYLVVTSVPNQWTRRRVVLTLAAARNAAAAARRRGQVASITLEELRLAAVVQGAHGEQELSP